jgi:plasmid stability protein
MATLHVRNVPDALYETLRGRAEKEGRSIGGQTVALLEEALGEQDRKARVLRRGFRRLPRRDLKPGERLGPGARQVLSAAQQEARALKHNYVGTEHLLLAILREPQEPAARALVISQGLVFDAVRTRVVEEIGEGDEVTPGQIPFTPRTKKVLELAFREALETGEDLMEPQHILVAIAREGEGFAAELLAEHGADLPTLRGLVTYTAGQFPPAPGQIGPPWLPGGWEYHVVALVGSADDWTRRLNELAGEGWQLESIQPDRAVFRRPRS